MAIESHVTREDISKRAAAENDTHIAGGKNAFPSKVTEITLTSNTLEDRVTTTKPISAAKAIATIRAATTMR